jgi:Ni,Fe-hydrogenase I small subunit
MQAGPTLLWIGCGSCSGESMAVVGVDGQATDLADLLEQEGVTLLWHPSLALEPLAPIAHRILETKVSLTLLCIEGSLAMGTTGHRLLRHL